MSAITLRPIDLPELWAFLAAKKSPVTAANYRALLLDVVRCRVLGCFANGKCVAIGGIADVGPDAPGIAWASVGTGGSGWFGIGAVRAIRTVIAVSLADRGAVLAIVADDNLAGQRLARSVGLVPGKCVIGGLRTWHGRCIDGKNSKKTIRAGATGAAGSGSATG